MRVGFDSDWLVSLQAPDGPFFNIKVGPFVVSGIDSQTLNGLIATAAGASRSYEKAQAEFSEFDSTWPPSGNFAKVIESEAVFSVDGVGGSDEFAIGLSYGIPKIASDNEASGLYQFINEDANGKSSSHSFRYPTLKNGCVLVESTAGAIKIKPSLLEKTTKTVTTSTGVSSTHTIDREEVIDFEGQNRRVAFISGDATSTIKENFYWATQATNRFYSRSCGRVISATYDATNDETMLVPVTTHRESQLNVFLPGDTLNILEKEQTRSSIIGADLGESDTTHTIDMEMSTESCGFDASGNLINLSFGDVQGLNSATDRFNVSSDYTSLTRFFLVGDEAAMSSAKSSIQGLSGNSSFVSHPLDISSLGKTWAEVVLAAAGETVEIIGIMYSCEQSVDDVPITNYGTIPNISYWNPIESMFYYKNSTRWTNDGLDIASGDPFHRAIQESGSISRDLHAVFGTAGLESSRASLFGGDHYEAKAL